MSKQYPNEFYVKRYFTLAKTIDVEDWLSNMATNGFILQRITNCKYYFIKSAPVNTDYFLMSPEVGTNSDGWVFYEFCQNFGDRIPSIGPSFMSPSHALIVNCTTEANNQQLIEYYYKYRNYRTTRRLFRNSAISLFFAAMCILVGVLGTRNHLIALFPYLIGSMILFVHFAFSFHYFTRSCSKHNHKKPMKKPLRPM